MTQLDHDLSFHTHNKSEGISLPTERNTKSVGIISTLQLDLFVPTMGSIQALSIVIKKASAQNFVGSAVLNLLQDQAKIMAGNYLVRSLLEKMIESANSDYLGILERLKQMHTGSECIAVEMVNAQFRETTVVEARDRPAAAVVAKMNQQNCLQITISRWVLSQGGRRSLTSLAQCMADNFYVGLCGTGGHKWKLKTFLRHQMKFLSRDLRGFSNVGLIYLSARRKNALSTKIKRIKDVVEKLRRYSLAPWLAKLPVKVGTGRLMVYCIHKILKIQNLKLKDMGVALLSEMNVSVADEDIEAIVDKASCYLAVRFPIEKAPTKRITEKRNCIHI
ncbi:hypothetical protein Tco_1294533 [Tanacetum coccineum]